MQYANPREDEAQYNTLQLNTTEHNTIATQPEHNKLLHIDFLVAVLCCLDAYNH